MTRAARSFPALLPALLLSALAAGCTGQSNVGNPCDKAEQCGEGLICDFHDGKGTCQEPHDHGTAGESEAHETDHHETEAHETEPHASETGSSGTGPTEATTTQDHGETEHDHTGTTADTTSSTG
ncbi:hypothetical protein [Nannocystis exedens]|nr:hypothetical protein [Nannocystis exedens]